MATACTISQDHNLARAHPGQFYTLWRARHPVIAERIEFTIATDLGRNVNRWFMCTAPAWSINGVARGLRPSLTVTKRQ
jgi:hypothetical protein